jgi:DNA-binding NarL/FixJ family response regulator
MLLDGLRVSHIAERLFVSEHTVRNHLRAIFRKCEVGSQAELISRLRD